MVDGGGSCLFEAKSLPEEEDQHGCGGEVEDCWRLVDGLLESCWWFVDGLLVVCGWFVGGLLVVC